MGKATYNAHPGETPFISACIDGELKTARALFSQGEVDLNARTDGDTTVLEEMIFKAANRPLNFKITRLNGSQVSIESPEEVRRILGSHPDDEFRLCYETALFVLDKGADPDSLNKNGQSALFTATGEGADWMIALLADHGANLDMKDPWGLTPLHYACRMGYPETAALLLERGASPDPRDEFGFTPAFEAASANDLKTLKVLAGYGADFSLGLTKPFKTNPAGTTPLQYAESHGFTEVADFLRSHVVRDPVKARTWTWDEKEEGYQGVQILEGKLLWFTHRENPHSPSAGAAFQEFDDFLKNGPRVSGVPSGIAGEIVDWISQD